MTDFYAVMGNPVEHSLSPRVHQLFAQQTGQILHYHKILVELDAFEDELRNFQLRGGKGLSITLPFKQRAFAYVDSFSSRAEQAGAVNTILFKQNAACVGDNTDGVGLVRDLTQNLKINLHDKRILLLGAGGAARGVMGPLLAQSPACLHIANRTLATAVALAALFAPNEIVSCSGFHDIPGRFDVIINATSSSLTQEVLPMAPQVIGEECCCYDMIYAKESTAFLRWAQQHGATSLSDGLGMLVEQGAEAFYLWRGVMPQTQAVIATIRESW